MSTQCTRRRLPMSDITDKENISPIPTPRARPPTPHPQRPPPSPRQLQLQQQPSPATIMFAQQVGDYAAHVSGMDVETIIERMDRLETEMINRLRIIDAKLNLLI